MFYQPNCTTESDWQRHICQIELRNSSKSYYLLKCYTTTRVLNRFTTYIFRSSLAFSGYRWVCTKLVDQIKSKGLKPRQYWQKYWQSLCIANRELRVLAMHLVDCWGELHTILFPFPCVLRTLTSCFRRLTGCQQMTKTMMMKMMVLCAGLSFSNLMIR